MLRVLYVIIGLGVLVGLGFLAAHYGRSLSSQHAVVVGDEYDVPVGFKTYTNSDYGLTFDYLEDDHLTITSGYDYDGTVWNATISPAGAGEWRPLGFGDSADYLTREVRIGVYKTLKDFELAKQYRMESQSQPWVREARGDAKTASNNGIGWTMFYIFNEESGQLIDVWMGVLESGYGIFVESEGGWGEETAPQEVLRSVRNI